MKTVSAKEFQLNQSKMMKEVASGTVYQVTYHGRPWVELHPGVPASARPRRGSLAAVIQSLDSTLESIQLPDRPDYKAIRKQRLAKKYGK